MNPIDQLARECGATPYVNRHAPGETAIAFGPQAWAKFCERVAALAELEAQQPVAWAVYWGLPPMRKNSVHFGKETAQAVAAEIKSCNTEIRPLVFRGAAPVAQQPQAEAAQKSEASSVRDADDVPTERAVLVREWKAMRLALSAPRPTRSDSLPAAMGIVIKAMRSDPEYAWGWHCNIAMAFVDAGGDHYTANQGAARFISALAGVGPAHELPAAPPQAEAVDDNSPSELDIDPNTHPSYQLPQAEGVLTGIMYLADSYARDYASRDIPTGELYRSVAESNTARARLALVNAIEQAVLAKQPQAESAPSCEHQWSPDYDHTTYPGAVRVLSSYCLKCGTPQKGGGQ